MSPRCTCRNILKFLIIVGIGALVLTVIVQLLTNDGRSYYYEPKYQHKIEAKEKAFIKYLYNEKIFTDKPEKVPGDSEWVKVVQEELPYVPFDFWLDYHKQDIKENTACQQYPYLFGLDYHNTYWQTYKLQNITFRLYGAYYDKRSSLSGRPVVRLLAMLDQMEKIEFPPNYCQFWFDNEVKPTVVPVMEHLLIYPDIWEIKSGFLYPYLITCSPLPTDRIPRTVSLVRSDCETATNNLRVWFEEPQEISNRNSFGVCVKGLYLPYTDNSPQLVEWLELQKILGASKVYIYKLYTHPNVTKVLDYYQKMNFVDLQQITLAKGEPNFKHFLNRIISHDVFNKRLNEFIPYNDCLYRHMYKHAYLAAIDIDEVLMPLQPQMYWRHLTQLVDVEERAKQPECKHGFAGICFPNVYFPNTDRDYDTATSRDIPTYFNMLRRTSRLFNHTDIRYGAKCLHNTAEVHTMHNHYPLTWLKTCPPVVLASDKAQLNHYRTPMNVDNDSEEPYSKDDLVQDTSLLRFKQELMISTQTVLRKLGFLRT